MTTRYDDILVRLRAAPGPDRGVDGRIAYALGWRFSGLEDGPENPLFDRWPGIGGRWLDRLGEDWPDGPPKWTASTDAATNLKSEQFPSLVMAVAFLADGGAQVREVWDADGDYEQEDVGPATRLPIAILIALFEALKAKETENG